MKRLLVSLCAALLLALPLAGCSDCSCHPKKAAACAPCCCCKGECKCCGACPCKK